MDIERSVVLVTGGAGSFGIPFVKECLKQNAKMVRIVDNCEGALVEASRNIKNPNVRFMYGDIRDKDRMEQLMRGVDILVHAAALKHVPICEYNPTEAIRTNIEGSLNITEVAIACNVKKVIGISTDKAVNPISSYGATKLTMERLFIESCSYTQTKFSCVRFGNFWGSSNSVVDLWEKEKLSGKITMTDKDMSRYFIRIDEAVDFTIRCIDRMKGGEIFIPIMPSYTLEELAKQVAPDCTVELVGCRQGEKKQESLYSEDEARHIERDKDCLIVRYR